MEEFALEDGEQVVMTVRQHIFVLIMRLIPFLLLAFVPGILLALLSVLSGASPDAANALNNLNISSGFLRFIKGIYLLFLWIAAFTTFTRYYLTVWVITNVRIVDIKQHGFFNREVSSFLLIRVQDMTTDVSGMLGTLIGFGRLDVETAGSIDKFSMDSIVHPEHVRDVIMSQVAQLHATGDPTAMSAQAGV